MYRFVCLVTIHNSYIKLAKTLKPRQAFIRNSVRFCSIEHSNRSHKKNIEEILEYNADISGYRPCIRKPIMFF